MTIWTTSTNGFFYRNNFRNSMMILLQFTSFYLQIATMHNHHAMRGSSELNWLSFVARMMTRLCGYGGRMSRRPISCAYSSPLGRYPFYPIHRSLCSGLSHVRFHDWRLEAFANEAWVCRVVLMKCGFLVASTFPSTSLGDAGVFSEC